MKVTFEEKVTAFQKQIASMVFPRNSLLLDKLNGNALVKRWIRQHRNVPAFSHRFELYDFLVQDVIGESPIDYLEFGVWKGASLHRWTEIEKHTDSRFWGFDSFKGLPEEWAGVRSAGAFDLKGTPPALWDDRVRLVQGWFQDTLPAFLRDFEPRSRLVIHHDSDLYSSVLYCLTMMDRIMVPGTVIIFDEFSSPLHEFRAVQDYENAYRRKLRPLAMTTLFAQQVAFEVV